MRIASGALTSSGSEKLDKQTRDTYPGQAYFAGTGPKGAYCGDCAKMVKRDYGHGYACLRYREMMGFWYPEELPRQARACKYFERRRLSYDRKAKAKAATQGGQTATNETQTATKGQ